MAQNQKPSMEGYYAAMDWLFDHKPHMMEYIASLGAPKNDLRVKRAMVVAGPNYAPRLYANDEFLQKIGPAAAAGVLVHEWRHVLLDHHGESLNPKPAWRYKQVLSDAHEVIINDSIELTGYELPDDVIRGANRGGHFYGYWTTDEAYGPMEQWYLEEQKQQSQQDTNQDQQPQPEDQEPEYKDEDHHQDNGAPSDEGESSSSGSPGKSAPGSSSSGSDGSDSKSSGDQSEDSSSSGQSAGESPADQQGDAEQGSNSQDEHSSSESTDSERAGADQTGSSDSSEDGAASSSESGEDSDSEGNGSGSAGDPEDGEAEGSSSGGAAGDEDDSESAGADGSSADSTDDSSEGSEADGSEDSLDDTDLSTCEHGTYREDENGNLREMDEDELQEFVDNLNQIIADVISKNPMPEDEKPTENDLDRMDQDVAEAISQSRAQAFSRAGSMATEAEKVLAGGKLHLGWLKLLQKINPEVGKEDGGLNAKASYNWARPRRTTSLIRGVHLPTPGAPRDKGAGTKQKPVALIALDFSGSIDKRLAHAMKDMAQSIPEQHIEARCFTFSTYAVPFDFRAKSNDVAGGGTDFSCIEQEARKIQKETGEYPYVICLTDGEAWFERYGYSSSAAPTQFQLDRNWLWVDVETEEEALAFHNGKAYPQVLAQKNLSALPYDRSKL